LVRLLFYFPFFSKERNNELAKSNLGIIFANFVSPGRFIASSNTALLINHHNDGDLLLPAYEAVALFAIIISINLEESIAATTIRIAARR